MKIAHRIAPALSAVVLFVGASSARAGVVTFNNSGGGFWDVDSNWNTGHAPTYLDRAVIPANYFCTIRTNVAADTVNIGSGGGLDVTENKTLTLPNSYDNVAGTPDNSVISGTLTLDPAGASGYGGKLRFDAASHTLTGTGALIGKKASTITIGTFTVTNQLATTDGGILGDYLTIDGISIDSPSTGSYLRNEGIVAAVSYGYGGGLTLQSYLALQDISTAKWNIDNGFMQFDRGATLNGNFTGIPCGAFGFNETVKTCGKFTRNGCYVTLGGGATFEYFDYDAGSPTCSPANPGTLTGSPACSPFNGYVVSSSVGCCSP